MTERGDCDPSYSINVDIRNGVVSHPNLRKLHGRVTSKGSAWVTVSVTGKSASGSGRLTRTEGRGRWRGRPRGSPRRPRARTGQGHRSRTGRW